MSRRDPNLKTAYEKDDPDFETASTSSQNSERRNQPKRKAKEDLDNKNHLLTLSISDDDLDDEIFSEASSEPDPLKSINYSR